MKTVGCLMLSACMLGLIACGPASGESESAPTGDAGGPKDSGAVFGDRDSAPELDTGTSPSGDGGACGDSGVDELDDDGVDSNCDGADGVVGKDVYVDGATGNDTNPGTPTKPKRTIDAALKEALARNGAVVVAAGSYKIDSIERAGSWRIVGGYGAGFVGKPKRELTTLEPGAASGLMIGAGAKGTLAHLSVLGASPTATGTATAHALRSKAELLVLDDVVVRASDGRAGESGKEGTKGPDGHAGPDTWDNARSSNYFEIWLWCDGIKQPAYSFSTVGGEANAEGNPAGNYAAKTPAGGGSAGVEGSDGADAAKTPSMNEDLVVWGAAADGLANGTPGYGGASGGTGIDSTGSWARYGGGGTGGCPGKGGMGGSSGGGAVAVLVLAGELQVSRSLIAAGSGGDGGSGGIGGPGGSGGLGGRPLSTDSYLCLASADPYGHRCAQWGGGGGAGGRGGRGGGGAGGWTIGVVNVGSTTAKVDGATVFQFGKPGVGGLGNGGGYAPSGEKRTTYSIVTP